MELTDENLDDMDCRPLGRETGVRIPAEMQASFDAAIAKRRNLLAAKAREAEGQE